MAHVRECQQCGEIYVPANGTCQTCDHGQILVYACEGVCECGLCPDVGECPKCGGGSGESDKPDVRVVLCEACGSEGRIYRGQYDDERDCGECPACEGTGGEIVAVTPITVDALDQPPT